MPAGKIGDDYVGALLKQEGVPQNVIISLLKVSACNVEGLRRYISVSQRRAATKLDLPIEDLDGFPRKVSRSSM